MRIFRHYVPTMAIAWLIGDVLVVLLAYAVGRGVADEGAIELGPALLLALLTPLLLHISDIYALRLAMGRREVIARILIAQVGMAILVAAIGFVIPALGLSRVTYFATMGIGTISLLVWRLAWLVRWSPDRMGRGVLVVGTGSIAAAIADLQDSGARPFRIAGFLDDDLDTPHELPAGYEPMGSVDDLLAVVDRLRPELIVVAQRDRRGSFPTTALLECRMRGIAVEDWPAFYEKVTGRIYVSGLRPSWLIFSDGFVKSRRSSVIKRGMDIVLALIGIIVSSPLMVAAAIAVALDSPGPILFRQTRSGQWGQPFVIWKFRSMRQDAEASTGAVWSQEGDARITRSGRFLRRTRVDELPQLFNVLFGTMSVVGPRPERPEFIEELEQSIPFYRVRLSVKPGITGWAQVRFPYGASVEEALEKLQYDLYYIKNLSIFLDLLIIISTVQVVLLGRGR